MFLVGAWLAGAGPVVAQVEPAPPADGARPSADERDALVAELRDLQQAFDQAVKENTQRSAELTQLTRTTRANVAAMEARISAAETAAQQAARARDQALDQVAAHRRALVALEREAATLRERLHAAGDVVAAAEAPAAPAPADLERRVTELLAENDRLRNELESGRAAAPREVAAGSEQVRHVPERAGSPAEVPARAAVEESAVDPASIQRIQELEQQLAGLEQENAGLRQRLEQVPGAADEVTRLRAQIVELTAQLAAAASWQEDLRAEARAATIAAEQATEERTALEAELAAVASASGIEAELRAQLEAAQAEVASARRESGWQPARPTPRVDPAVARPTPLARSSSVDSLAPAPLAPAAAIRRAPTRPGSTINSPDGSGAGRFHVVANGDTLTRISARYYGTSRRWNDVYEANRGTLAQADALRPGQRLRIP